MESIEHANLFFIISSVGFVLLSILAAVALWYIIFILRRWLRMSRKIEEGLEEVKKEANTFLDTLKSSRLFSWLFRKKKAKRSK